MRPRIGSPSRPVPPPCSPLSGSVKWTPSSGVSSIQTPAVVERWSVIMGGGRAAAQAEQADVISGGSSLGVLPPPHHPPWAQRLGGPVDQRTLQCPGRSWGRAVQEPAWVHRVGNVTAEERPYPGKNAQAKVGWDTDRPSDAMVP